MCGQYQPMQLYLREGFSLPAQASFFLICVGDRAGLGYWSHFMSRPECIQVGVDVYIRHHKYQVKPHSSSWFSAACAATIVYRSHFFHLYQQNKSFESKAKFRQASYYCKKGLEAVKLAYANKTKESIISQRLGSRDFKQIPIVFSTKINLLYLLYSTTQWCCLLHLIKQTCLLKTFLRTLNLITQICIIFP